MNFKKNFVVNPDMIEETFDDGSVFLNTKTREVMEISADEHWLLSEIKKKYSYDIIKRSLKRRKRPLKGQVDNCLQIIYNSLFEKKLLLDSGDIMEAKYMQNPAVNLREEDEDGALLFNPDNNRIQLLNCTGFFIWKLCVKGKTLNELSDAVMNEFSGVPKEQVSMDTKKFLDEMVEIGFIEIVKTKKSKGV